MLFYHLVSGHGLFMGEASDLTPYKAEVGTMWWRASFDQPFDEVVSYPMRPRGSFPMASAAAAMA
jgi:hypothetical protein